MSDPLVFLMGKHPAELPTDRRYCKNHMWAAPGNGAAVRFGFSSYAVRLMQDVYFLEWKIDAGSAVRLKQEIGFIEVSKAQSELYAPVAGMVTAFNAELLNDPSAINADGYAAGWLFEMAADFEGTLTPAEYHEFLTVHWEQTQRLLKKQVHWEED